MTPRIYAEWFVNLHSFGPQLSDRESEACARLVTVLLCGEQSAIQIFSAEVRRGRAPLDALNSLRAIERDEQLHEKALRVFCTFLPSPDDAHALKRRAQLFFAKLGRGYDMAHHFGQISHLDSAVCKIMWHIENATADRTSPLRRIANQIKVDEARHVSVSREYASALGLNWQDQADDGINVTDGLIDLLEPLTDSFEVVGVDSDRLFRHLRKNHLP